MCSAASPREPTTTVDPWPTILAEANDLVKQTPRAKAKIVQNESLDKITQYLEELTLEKGVMMEAVERRATIANMSALMGSKDEIDPFCLPTLIVSQPVKVISDKVVRNEASTLIPTILGYKCIAGKHSLAYLLLMLASVRLPKTTGPAEELAEKESELGEVQKRILAAEQALTKALKSPNSTVESFRPHCTVLEEIAEEFRAGLKPVVPTVFEEATRPPGPLKTGRLNTVSVILAVFRPDKKWKEGPMPRLGE